MGKLVEQYNGQRLGYALAWCKMLTLLDGYIAELREFELDRTAGEFETFKHFLIDQMQAPEGGKNEP